MAGKNKIITKNKDLYLKLNQLRMVNEVTINCGTTHINRIIKNINKNENIVSWEKINNMLVLRKHKPFTFDIYFRR